MKCKIVIWVLFLCLSWGPASIGQSVLNGEKLMEIPRIGSPQVSPDAAWLLYSRSEVNISENNSKTHLVIQSMSTDRRMELKAEKGSLSSAQWVAPDKIWCLNSESGFSHIWEYDLSGEKRQITDGEYHVKMFGTSKDMSKVWIVRDVDFEPILSSFNDGLDKIPGAKVYDGLMYRHWMSWYEFKHQHVFVADYRNATITEWKDIMEGEPYDSPLKPFGSAGQIQMHPEGKYLAYTSKKESGTSAALSTNSGIYLYDFSNGKTSLLTADNKGYDTYPSFSPDGKWLAWFSMETPGYEADKNRLMIRNMDNGQVFELTAQFENGADAVKWHPTKGKQELYFIAGVEATQNIYKATWTSTPAQVSISPVTKEVANYTEMSLAVQGTELTMVASRMSMRAPTEIFGINTSSGAAKRLTFDTDVVMNQVAIGQVEKRWIPTTDGKEMLTWVIYPPDFDPAKKYPALLYCQGGPQSTVSQFFSFRWNFQVMAAAGYIVVAPNRRGLPSFGQAWNEQISGDWGGQAMEDLLSAIDAVAKESYVDETKLGAVGASFGGYSVYWLAGNHNKRFKSFISHCGVFNLESMYGSTEEMFFVHHDLGGAYWEKPVPKSYQRFSPHSFVSNWDTPILVIHNELDFRVPLAQGMEAFTAAQMQGVPSRFLYFADEGHWVVKPQNSILWHRVFFDWLDTYLK